MRNTKHIILTAAVLVTLVAAGLWLRGYKERLKAEGALAEAMKSATAQRRADSLALAAAQDSLRVLGLALERSARTVATSAGNWQSTRLSKPDLAAIERLVNAEVDSARRPLADSLAVVMHYATRLEHAGDSLQRSCTMLANDCQAFRRQAAATDSAHAREKADIQRQLAIAMAQARNKPSAVSRWTRNAGWLLAGVGVGVVLERVR